ncbi:MAG: hypothetical protein KZQ65_01150 [Candidatus Thiodiazotropha sp. (ex Gloverina cf. vestifex)]|nr:hypothetical protein [Candidatus Thiodiazotropha sp. (ex Gloverina cf. vestifex)]
MSPIINGGITGAVQERLMESFVLTAWEAVGFVLDADPFVPHAASRDVNINTTAM